MEPLTRKEKIIAGQDIKPLNRREYFLRKAATEVPKPTAADAGKVVTVNEDGDGYILEEGGTNSGNFIITCVGVATFNSEDNMFSIPIDKTMNEILTALNAGAAVYCKIPTILTTEAPYYSYSPTNVFQLPLCRAGVGGGNFLFNNSVMLDDDIIISNAELNAVDNQVTLLLFLEKE